jgi:hypothetical protein
MNFGIVHANNVNYCIGRYFEIFSITKVLEIDYETPCLIGEKETLDSLPKVLLYYRPTVGTVWREISSASHAE